MYIYGTERRTYMEILLNIPGLLIAIIFHELAHGFIAYLLGDDTAKSSGRLSLNPLKHLDPIGVMAMLVFKFGWAKPVPINPTKFKSRRRDTILVSLAGPISNFIIALIVIFLLSLNIIRNQIIFEILRITLWYNVMLGVFNLLPFPPLDGSKIFASLLPRKLEYFFYKYQRYFYFVLIILIFTGIINKILGPLVYFVLNLFLRFFT